MPSPSQSDTEHLAVLVLGMHRSGTSALARLVGYLDIALPSDGIDAHPDNSKGYWEPQAVVAVDDRILRTARTSWFDPRPFPLDRIPPGVRSAHRADLRSAIWQSYGNASRIVIKDPRLCRLVPMITDALAEDGRAVRAVLMLRSPAAVAQSLHRRDRSTTAYAHALWLRHMIDAERATRDLPRVVLTYDSLLDDWHAPMARLARLAGRAAWTPDDATVQAIDAFLDHDLRHHSAGQDPALEPQLASHVMAIERSLLALVDADDDEARTRVDTLAQAWESKPDLLDDIIHDELRHRRFEELRLRSVYPELEASLPPTPPSPAQPEAVPIAPAEVAPIPVSLKDQVTTISDSRLFDTDWYVTRYPDVTASGLDPIVHYLTIGAARGYDPNPLFRTGYYAWQLSRRDAADAI